ncbi:MAG: AraC family transcriptional regulator [Candidatus Eisenbacteria bacterium]|nr:AraC family transcriptional regulator [Candidatus Eisenbacteria bacterium]
MIPSRASVLAVQKSRRRARVFLRRVCLFGLEPSTVRALGQLLGKHFCFLLARGDDELFSTIRSTDRLDGLVLGARPSHPDAAEVCRAKRWVGTADPKETVLPIFVFVSSDDASTRGEMESLGAKWFFQNPGDIWKLAEAIHKELGPVDDGTNTATFGAGPEAIIIGTMTYIDQNLVSIRSSTEISNHLGVTREHLSRQFTRYTGQTLWDFIATRRVHKAMELLGGRELLVKQISREVGFNCESSFFRAFTKKTGLTPEGFRKARLG